MRRQLPVHSPLPVGAIARAMVGKGSSARERLSRSLAERLDVSPDRIVLTGSGTQALALALETVLRSGGRGPVAVPAYTCWDVGTAVQAAEREARFFDLDPTRLAPDLDSVDAALSDGATALVVSPLFGYPVDWDRLRDLAAARGAVLVEDAAQSHGSRWTEGAPGTLGDLAILSFARGKGWTGAGGGALVVRSPRLAAHVPQPPPPSGPVVPPRWLAGALAQAVWGRPTLYGIPASLPWLRLGESVYHPPTSPRGMRAVQAAVLLSTETAAEEEAHYRRERAALLLRSIPAGPRVRPVRPAGSGQPGFLRFPVLVADPPPEWAQAARAMGVVPAYPRVLPDVSQLGSIVPPSVPALPGARLLADQLFTVPTHSLLRPAEVDRLVALLAGEDTPARPPAAARSDPNS